MSKKKKLTAAIKQELTTLKNDLQILGAQFATADSEVKKAYYSRLITLAQDRAHLLQTL